MDYDVFYEPENGIEPHDQPPLSQTVLKRARLATSLCFAVNGCAFASWVSRIPLIKHELAMSDSQLGFALFALAGGALVGFPLAGVTCAKFGSKLVSIVLGVFFCFALAAIPFANRLPTLMVALACFGIFHGGMDVAMNANGVEVEGHYGRSIMSSLHGMYSLGGLVGAAAGMLATRLNVSTTAHLLAAAGCFLMVICFAWTVMLADKPSGHIDHPIFAVPSKPLLAIGAIVTCAFLCEGAMGDWSGVYLRETLRTSSEFAVAGYLFYSLMMTVSRFSGDRILTRWGPVLVLRVAGVVAATGLGVALLIGTPASAIFGFGCIGLGMSTIAPIGFGAAGRTPGVRPGSAIAAVATMGYSGFLVGPPIIGVIAQVVGLRVALVVVAVLAACIVLLAGAAAHGQREENIASG